MESVVYVGESDSFTQPILGCFCKRLYEEVKIFISCALTTLRTSSAKVCDRDEWLTAGLRVQ